MITERTTKEQTALSHPLYDSFLMSCYFTKQVLVQLDFLRLWKGNEACKTDVCLLPGQLEEKVARLHLLALGEVLTVFAQEYAVHVRVKAEHHRY